MPKKIKDKNYPHLGGNHEGGDCKTFYPTLWKKLVDDFKIKSVLDIGCGEGISTKFFKDLDCISIGIDGLSQNVHRTLDKECIACIADLTKSAFKFPVDLVWCCEVVEHIEEKYIDNLLTTLSNGKIIAMTHAVIGQGGHHHVNCQNSNYWIEHLKRYNFQYLKDETEYYRTLSDHYFKKTGLVFKIL